MKILFIAYWILVAIAPVAVLADVATSTNYIIENAVIDSGGGYGTSTNFLLRNSLGQPAQGLSTSTSFILKGGFLYFPSATTTVATTTPATSTPTSTTSGPVAGTGGGSYGTSTVPIKPPKPIPFYEGCSADFNGDGRINIIDLSILLYHYDETGKNLGCYDLNKNEVVDFPDLSILMFYWTN